MLFSTLLWSSLCTSLASAAAFPAAPDAHAPFLYYRDVPISKRSSGKVSTHPQVTIKGDVCTVKPLGGARDDSSALLYAFSTCSSRALIELPGFYTVGRVLNTTLSSVEVRLSGTIQYTPDVLYWSNSSIYLTYQDSKTNWFFSGKDITLHGGGTIDGAGQATWSYFALNPISGPAGSSTREFARPITLTIGNASNVLVEDINVVQGANWLNFVYQSTNIRYNRIFATAKSFNASAPAKNTDGWDIYRSSHVSITNSLVINDDDCVSFKPNSSYITIENLDCRGSHGISVGSLGQYAGETDIVENVFIRNISMSDAQNGARIKVFGGSNDTKSVTGGGSGYVRNVTFMDFANHNVDNPILIDQCYSTTAAQCAAYPATLSISDIHYVNVTGTSSGKVKNGTVASLQCSAPCTNITAVMTNLSPPNGTARYLCKGLKDESTLDWKCTDV